MSDDSTIVSVIRERQAAIRRELDRRQIPMKVVAQDSGIQYATLLTYFPADERKQPHQIPGSAIFALAGAIPDDLISLLLPSGFLIVRLPEEIDHDSFAAMVNDYQAAKEEAHRVDSPAGRDLADCELEKLDSKVARIRAAGQ